MWEYVLIPHQQGLDVVIHSQDCMWEYVMCIYDTMLWSIICMCFRITLRFNYIYVFSGSLYVWKTISNILSEIVKSNSCFAWLYFVYIVHNCLLDVWFTPSITIFRLKFSWGTEPLDCFVRCKVERVSFRRSQ